ncbi:hypothetical protein [Streptomyces sp. Y7]|uniref:hypothetical protein n=1 Tax=Streptomyces sp. Y7 TaxID=3342392 RepID=UPI00371A5C31
MISNEIRFDCQHRGDRGPLVVVPHIDGAPLTELIDEYEIAAGMQPAGDAYGGLIPELFRFGPMQDHFLGLSTSAMGPKTGSGASSVRRQRVVTVDLVSRDSEVALICSSFG